MPRYPHPHLLPPSPPTLALPPPPSPAIRQPAAPAATSTCPVAGTPRAPRHAGGASSATRSLQPEYGRHAYEQESEIEPGSVAAHGAMSVNKEPCWWLLCVCKK
eukprot:2588883-Pleurochrysis_carterae.AAC.1